MDFKPPLEYITIDVKKYQRLLQSEEVLLALQIHGVDNWEGYDIAIQMLKKDQEDGKRFW